ncbi:AAA family ATPase [Psychrobacter sp. I-STPA10]|uniref:AAA family ATPase n=1 Tax=Psychrobacter sp. I-STPA10 TaxID=2585769 RepID=UPI001E538037|nr:AAA family ATPase [Psychrobacter sp. I-STPA10]
MKILESKYYRDYHFVSFEDDRLSIQKADKLYWGAKGNSYSYLLDYLFNGIYLGNDSLVISQSQLQDFVKCTDFTPLVYSSQHNRFYQPELCYFHPEYEIFIHATQNLSNEYDVELFDSGMLRVIRIAFDCTRSGMDVLMDKFLAEYLQKYVSSESKVAILFKTCDGFELKTHKIKPYHVDLDLMYNDDFLPVHQHIKEHLTNENKGVVLLHGIAGSGKTNYIKWLTSQVPSKQFIFVPTNMIALLTSPEFMSLLVENKNSVLVLEDCENYIAERTADNNHTDVVSSILNIADGMLSDILECQFICTFNSDISKIDEALLRKGRLIAEYKFRELSVEKANAYLQAQAKLKNDDLSLDSDEPYVAEVIDEPLSLAELTNFEDASFKEVVKKTKIGFV